MKRMILSTLFALFAFVVPAQAAQPCCDAAPCCDAGDCCD